MGCTNSPQVVPHGRQPAVCTVPAVYSCLYLRYSRQSCTAGLDQVSELRAELEVQKQAAVNAEAHRQRLEHRLATLEVRGSMMAVSPPSVSADAPTMLQTQQHSQSAQSEQNWMIFQQQQQQYQQQPSVVTAGTGVGGGVINPHTPAGLALLRSTGNTQVKSSGSATPSIASRGSGSGIVGGSLSVRDILGTNTNAVAAAEAPSMYSMAAPIQQHHLQTPSASSPSTPLLRNVPNHIPSLQDRLAAADAAIRNLGASGGGASVGARIGAGAELSRVPTAYTDALSLNGSRSNYSEDPFLTSVSPLKDTVLAASKTTGMTIEQLLTPGGYKSASMELPPSTAAAVATGAAAAIQQQELQPYQYSTAHALAQFSPKRGGPSSSLAPDPLRAAAEAAFGLSV